MSVTPSQTASLPTFTPFPPYTNKQVVIDYYVIGQRADYGLLFDAPHSVYTLTKFVVYDDGQMILAGADETYRQIVLSSGEVQKLLSTLELLGFNSIESNQKHDPTDKLYDYGTNYQKSSDGLRSCILVNTATSRELCVYEPDQQYLIPEMKNILKYLDGYKPAGLTPYIPDRILLSIQNASPSEELILETAVPWDEHFPPLQSSRSRQFWDTSNEIRFVGREMAEEIYQAFNGTDMKVFSQNDKEYIVYLHVLLPHEQVRNLTH